ncbi:MAG: SsrA-binding protein SmpB [Acidobacteriota bacterium]
MARKASTARDGAGTHRPIRTLASNRKARHDYHVLETVEAGLQLTGTEVKSARDGRIVLRDAFVSFRGEQAFLEGAQISHYSHGNRENHLPDRPRKLLLKQREIERLAGRVQTKGLSVVPLSMYLKGPWIKTEIALVQGKKLHDKRDALRQKTLDREARQAMKDAGGQRY